MSKELDPRLGLDKKTAGVSLIAVLACALASDAPSLTATEQSAGALELSARVATLAERIRLARPALAAELPHERKIAQWRNS